MLKYETFIEGGKIMEVKPWREYSFSEKSILLNFWFTNTNSLYDEITKEDREQFKHLLEKNIDLVKDYVIVITMLGRDSATMLMLMRDGSLETLEEILGDLKKETDEDHQLDEDYQFIENQVITMLVGLCNAFMATTDEETIIKEALQLAMEARKAIMKRFY